MAKERLEKVWDPVTRVLHWAMVFCFTASWVFAEFGPAVMTLHFYFGYTMAALVAMRLIWGIVGPRPVRFASFVKGLPAILAYGRGLFSRAPSLSAGHNPVGALFIIGVLTLLPLQILTGLYSDPEDYINVGPLAETVTIETARRATALHETISGILILLVVIHVAAVVFYYIYKRENLVKPMITGWKRVRDE
jgi:cytochrome b